MTVVLSGLCRTLYRKSIYSTKFTFTEYIFFHFSLVIIVCGKMYETLKKALILNFWCIVSDYLYITLANKTSFFLET